MPAEHDLSTLLSTQKQQLDALLLLLRQEIAALSTRNPEQLETIIQKKLSVLEAVQQTDLAIAQSPDLNEVKQQDWFKNAVQLADDVLQQCKQQNEINQKTVEQSQITLEHFKTTLLSVRGKAGLTYSSKGKPSIDSKGKDITA